MAHEEGDEHEFKLSEEERKRMYGEFASSKSYDPTDNDVIYGKDISNDWSQIKEWDDCVPINDKREINEKNLANIVKGEKCPLLKQPKGAVYFLFCWQLANLVRVRGNEFTSSPSPQSAQYEAKISAQTIESCCTCLDKFKECKRNNAWFGKK